MRVLHVTFHRPARAAPPAEHLAAWPVLTAFVNMLAEANLDVTAVVAAHADGALTDGRVPFRFITDGGLSRLIRHPRRLLEVARALRPDVVHVQGLVFPVQTWRLSRVLPGVPIVVQDRAGRPPRDGVRRLIHRRGLASVAAAVFAAREQFDAYVRAGVLRPDLRVVVLAGGTCGFHPGDRAAARRATRMDGDPCLLWVGHLDANKDPLTALEGFRRALVSAPRAELYMAYGTAPLAAEVQAWLDGHDEVSRRVHLVGRVPNADLEARYRAADAFLLASHREGGNLSTVEALACGTPVVVTDLPSFRRIAGDGDAAGYFAPRDPVGLAEALARAIQGDAAVREARRAAARARFEAHLSGAAVGRRLASLYQELGR